MRYPKSSYSGLTRFYTLKQVLTYIYKKIALGIYLFPKTTLNLFIDFYLKFIYLSKVDLLHIELKCKKQLRYKTINNIENYSKQLNNISNVHSLNRKIQILPKSI